MADSLNRLNARLFKEQVNLPPASLEDDETAGMPTDGRVEFSKNSRLPLCVFFFQFFSTGRKNESVRFAGGAGSSISRGK